MARSAPFSFTTMPMISTSLGGSSCSSTFSLSAICGTAFGETKLAASMCLNPTPISARKYCAFTSVGISALSPCHASRGHSISFTASLGIVEILGNQAPWLNRGATFHFPSYSHLLKEFLRTFKETFAHWRVFLAAQRGKFFELAALFSIQTRWHLHD